jgi:Prophage minor tail protein Z (GPZ)
MTVSISIKTNFPEVARALSTLQGEVAGKALASAMNKTVEQAKTAMSREIREEFVLPAAKVAQALRIDRARASGGRFALQAALYSPAKRGRSLNLGSFAAKQTARGVTFKVRRGGGRKLIPGAFLINGGKTVMIRVGKARLPIVAKQTIDVAQMFNTRRINAKVVEFIETKFPVLFANEARYFVNRFNQAGK